ncbi:hypothetical protein SCLCIDRAFT_1211883 [Scleroderma citrinum Foug A]|uniref:Cytochrome P450 n=1 Tax=Scleroderma citrinum Foug A TaxID=1036808 RepID=A0A0C3DZ82_9AGAM|nr:hypothetical protein SCLCIDRAFT_1211883 [Scleroderma citrinum Foug A]
MEELPNFQLFCGIGLAASILACSYAASRPHPLDHIPTVGSPGLLGSYWSAVKYISNAIDIVQQGFNKYKTDAFRVSTMHGWIVYLNPSHLEEVMKLPTDVMSFELVLDDMVRMEYTFGSQISHHHYNLTIIRTRLTRNLSVLLPGIKDEMVATLDGLLDMKPNEWKSIPVVDYSRTITASILNRTVVRLPLCRDPDWVNFTVQSTMDAIKEGVMLGGVPDFLLTLSAKFITTTSSRLRRGVKHLDPIIKERLRCMQAYGEKWTDRPFDVLQWFMDDENETTTPLLTARILFFIFGGMISTSIVLAKVLCFLATNPQCVQPLREEVEMVIDEHGWTREGIAQMRRVDSFIKETLRFDGSAAFGVQRKTTKDVTLSDGTFLPQGTHVAVPAYAIEHDHHNYENPFSFEPFRFVDLQDKCGDLSKYQLTSVSHDSLMFGFGKSACPGRFLASMTLKALLAYIVVTYDLKPGKDFPDSQKLAGVILTRPSAKLLFRKRMD